MPVNQYISQLTILYLEFSLHIMCTTPNILMIIPGMHSYSTCSYVVRLPLQSARSTWNALQVCFPSQYRWMRLVNLSFVTVQSPGVY